jgi:histone H3/H4
MTREQQSLGNATFQRLWSFYLEYSMSMLAISATRTVMKPIVVMLIFVAAPVCAQAQRTPATKADVQNVFKIITEDPAKIQAFCDIGKIGDEMEQANAKRDSKKVEELSLKADELGKQLGPEYAALMDGIGDVDPESEVGLEIRSTIQELDKLCTR